MIKLLAQCYVWINIIVIGERGKKNFEGRYDVELEIKPG